MGKCEKYHLKNIGKCDVLCVRRYYEKKNGTICIGLEKQKIPFITCY